MSSFTTSRSGSPINLMKNDSYKKYYSVSNNFLKEHKHLLKCTSCNTNLFNSIKQGKFNIHPMLKVLICQKCYDFYTSGELSQDEDGSDKYCRWCGNGGHLYICSQCPYGFCKGCYQNNFPDIVENMSDENWKCIVCEDGPLHKHQALVHVLLHLSPSKSSRVRKRRSSPDSDTPVNKISKFSEKNNKDKKDKITLDLIDSTTHSNHEDFAIPVLENPNEEFNDKSKYLLLSSINDLQSTMKFGLEESTKLLNKINKSDLDNSSEVLKFYQLLDELQSTLKSRIENYVGSTRKIIQKSKKINDNSQEKNQKKKNDVLLVESSDSDSEKKTNKLKSLNNENRFEVEENLEANLDNPMNKRRNIKSIIEDKNTSQSTKKAAMNEGKRQLIEQPQTLVYDLMEGDASNDNIILDSQSEVRVHPGIAVKLKPHQVGAECESLSKDYALRPRKSLPKKAYLCKIPKRKGKSKGKSKLETQSLILSKKELYPEKLRIYSDPIVNNNIETESLSSLNRNDYEDINRENFPNLFPERNTLINESNENFHQILNLNLFSEYSESQMNLYEKSVSLKSSTIQEIDHQSLELTKMDKNKSDDSFYDNSIKEPLNEQLSFRNENDGSDFTTISKLVDAHTISLKKTHPHCSCTGNHSTNQNDLHTSNNLIQSHLKNHLNKSNNPTPPYLGHAHSCCSCSNCSQSYSDNNSGGCHSNKPSHPCNNCHSNFIHSLQGQYSFPNPSCYCTNKVVILMH